jgi:hypothetical protein
MKSISLLNIAASIAMLTVLLIALILVPEPLWSATTIATAIGFASSVGYVFYVPSIVRQKTQSTDASQMAALGPLGAVSIALLIATGGGFVLALVGYQKLGLAMLVFGIGAFFVMSLVLNAALKVVGDISAKWSQPSHHVNWQSEVTVLASLSTHKESLAKLHALIEKLRYSASDVMSERLQSDPAADLTSQFSPINGLLAQRDVYLRTARSKA